MDASKLRNSCICGNTIPYLDCCGHFADPWQGHRAGRSKSNSLVVREGEKELHHAFRHTLHELSMALFPLRAIYQAYWEKLAQEDYPHEKLMDDPEYGRSVIENFFWDYFVQYSDARPILRTAREIESKDLRLAHDLMQWSYAPLWFYRVQSRNAKTAKLLNLGNNKIHTVHHAGRIPEVGSGLLTRILPFRGLELCGHASLALGADSSASRLDALFRAGCRELGVKNSVTLRPDVHCEEWRRHGALFLGIWRAEVYDAKAGRPSSTTAANAPFTLDIQSREALLRALEATVDAVPVGVGIWDVKHRALRLARLEPEGEKLKVTLYDSGFHSYVRNWLTDRLGSALSHSEELQEVLPGPSSESQDMWIHTALGALNAQTPIQASTHDWGRRRLQLLLKDMVKKGVDVTLLRQQLDL